MQEHEQQQFPGAAQEKVKRRSLLDFVIGPIIPERWSDNKKFYVLLLVLLVGLVYSVVSIPLLSMGTDAVSSVGVYVLFSMYIIGILIILICVVLGLMHKSHNMTQALFFLKLPFYYGVFFVAITLFLSFIGI